MRVGGRHTEQRQDRRQRRAKLFVQGEQLAGDLFPDRARLVAVLDLEICPEQIDDRKVRRGPPVGDRSGLEDEAAVDQV